jgi:hypothetical protein
MVPCIACVGLGRVCDGLVRGEPCIRPPVTARTGAGEEFCAPCRRRVRAAALARRGAA